MDGVQGVDWLDRPPPAWFDGDHARINFLREDSFSLDEYTARRERLLEMLGSRRLDALVVYRPSNVEYLCGYHTVARLAQPLLVTPGGLFLFIPPAELGSAMTTACDVNVVVMSLMPSAALGKAMAERVGERASVGMPTGWRGAPHSVVADLASRRRVLDDEGVVEELRLQLSSAEQALVRTAAEATNSASEVARSAARSADSERELAGAVTNALWSAGSSAAATNLILAQGRRIGVPHSTWGNRPLREELVFLEFAGSHHRYVAPVMLTLARRHVSGEERRLEELAQTMLASTRRLLEVGRTAHDVAVSVTQELGDIGTTLFHNVYGYAIGLAHPPSWMDGADFQIALGNSRIIKPGMTFHLPGTFRLFGRTGVGLSHTVIVNSDHVDVLTGASPRIHAYDSHER